MCVEKGEERRDGREERMCMKRMCKDVYGKGKVMGGEGRKDMRGGR